MDTLADKNIEEILQHQRSIQDIMNFCASSPRYRPFCHDPRLWDEYARRLKPNYDEHAEDAVRYEITPVIERYLSLRGGIHNFDYNRFLSSALNYAIRYNKLHLIMRFLNEMAKFDDKIQDDYVGNLATKLLENNHLYLAESLINRYPSGQAVGYFLVAIQVYQPDLLRRYAEKYENRIVDYENVLHWAVYQINNIHNNFQIDKEPIQMLEEFLAVVRPYPGYHDEIIAAAIEWDPDSDENVVEDEVQAILDRIWIKWDPDSDEDVVEDEI